MSRDELYTRIRVADQRITDLKKDIDLFCEEQRPRVVISREGSAVTTSLPSPQSVPVEWRVNIGEIAHVLRSALNHLVWLLVLENGNKPNRRNGFPIFRPMFGEELDLDRMLKGVSEGHKRDILAFNHDWQANLFPLWHLQALSNVDKHRYTPRVVTNIVGLRDDYWDRQRESLEQDFGFPEIKREDVVIQVLFIAENSALAKEWEPRGEVVYNLRECAAAVKGVADYVLFGIPVSWPFVRQ